MHIHSSQPNQQDANNAADEGSDKVERLNSAVVVLVVILFGTSSERGKANPDLRIASEVSASRADE